MSTFSGIVKEFPTIRIDNFTTNPHAPYPSNQPPLACFLSHVHSDHLRGLESKAFRSPFIYCTVATREVLLRLEKYPHRMNFAKGILESRRQTYKHLKALLKPLPLESPTVIKLSGNSSIQITLFDANHCVGSCMFLIEGDGKAILYTGDVRSETWWVNTLIRSPSLIRWTTKGCMRLDNIYLDTTFAFGDALTMTFPPKVDGLSYLLGQVDKYDKDTVFYLDAWTFGYEEVWLALATRLNSRVHLDRYRFRLYRSVQDDTGTQLPGLLGFTFGNHYQHGCLTDGSVDVGDERDLRIHSCERGTHCKVFQNKNVVRITPIITRHKGIDIAEIGAGGGQGDMDQIYELELDDIAAIGQLIAMAASKLHEKPQLQSSLLEWLSKIMMQGGASVKLDIADFWDELQPEHDDPAHFQDLDNLPLDRLIPALVRLVSGKAQEKQDFAGIKKRITFPFSRHSSYEELRFLVAAFMPKDIHPCTVDNTTWTPAVSMQTLFGDLCSDTTFHHDARMDQLLASRQKKKPAAYSAFNVSQYQKTQLDQHDDERHTPKRRHDQESGSTGDERHTMSATKDVSHTLSPPDNVSRTLSPAKDGIHTARAASIVHAPHTSATAASSGADAGPASAGVVPHTPSKRLKSSATSTAARSNKNKTPSDVAQSSARAKRRREVQASVLGTGGKTWAGLSSVSGYHNQEPEREL